MNDDEISLIVQNDDLIVKLGVKLLKSINTNQKSTMPYTTQRMRELGRLLQKLRMHDEPSDLASYILPSKFDVIVQAVRDVSGKHESSGSYKIPTLALRLGHSLYKCAGILQSEGLRKGDQKQVEDSQNFQKLYKSDWNAEISKKALITLQQSRWNKPKNLPLEEDIKN